MKAMVIAVVVTIMPTVLATTAAAQTGGVDVDALMQRKLSSAQAVLKGLALEDYATISSGAHRLQLLSHDVGWNILQTKEYKRHSEDFRNAAESIEKAADNKNLDAAGLGYVKLTLTCIDCHRHVRAAKR